MVFSSPIFLFVFLPVTYLGYRILPGLPLRNAWLTLASLVFFSFGQLPYLVLLLISVLINYLFGLWLQSGERHRRLAAGLAAAANLSLLGVFKYVDFMISTFNSLSGAELALTGIVLPIGISFYTFQGMSYVIDVYRHPEWGTRNPGKLLLYISFFPQLIAGPIVKYETVADQIDNRQESWDDFAAGCARFIAGLGKKVLIANQVAVVADRAFNLGNGELSASFAWLGAICYTLQIYYDFSGYSDMAIGLGKMFGFHFLENFNYPYISKSITEFWRRWHISLSACFRDYVYFPLGGSRVSSKWKHIRNLFVVWLLTGVWHGANWTFIVWGLLYFVLLVLEKYGHLGRGWPVWLNWLFTLLMVNFAWVIFRADSLGAAGQYLLAMFGGGAGAWSELTALYLRENWTVLLAGLVFAAPVAPRLRDWLVRRDWPMVDLLYALGAAAVFLVSAAFIIKGTYNPFIYFNF